MSIKKVSAVACLLFVSGSLFLLYRSSSSPNFQVNNQFVSLRSVLPFVPLKIRFSCDDLFNGSFVDTFNFTDQYYNDRPAFLREINRLTNGVFSGDGHAAMFPTQYETLHYLSGMDFVTSVCETGFNYGHSSFAFATAKKDNKILSFDIGFHKYTKPMMEYLQRAYPGKFTTILGDSRVTLPKFVSDNPSYRCNMFFVDGSHTYKVGYSDLKHFSKIADKDNIIVFDDFPTLDGRLTRELGRAWEQAKEEKILVELMRCTRATDQIRGFTIGKFIC